MISSAPLLEGTDAPTEFIRFSYSELQTSSWARFDALGTAQCESVRSDWKQGNERGGGTGRARGECYPLSTSLPLYSSNEYKDM